ncbi:MAG: hypothetical protein ACXWH5_04540 [Actinomycetota bacterium]
MSIRTRSVAPLFVLIALSAAACTGDQASSTTPSSPTPGASDPVTTSSNVTFVPGEFEYTFNSITARFSMDGSSGTLTVKNGSGAELGDPSVFVVGIDDKRYEGTVASPAPVPDGGEATFQVTFPDKVTKGSIGLLVLLFGGDNYGAMAPVPAS